MCSRYDLTSPPEAVRAYFGYRDLPNFPPRGAIRPSEPIAVIVLDEQGTRRFRLMRWGLLPAFVKDPKKFPTLFNARSEDVLNKPSFRNAVRRRRCLIPADGFTEWTGPKGHRRPYQIQPKVPQLLAFAGLYESWSAPEGGVLDTATILTCTANGTVGALHDRMPVLLDRVQFDAWLDVENVSAEEALAMCGPAADDLLKATEVPRKASQTRPDDPVKPENEEPQQLPLL